MLEDGIYVDAAAHDSRVIRYSLVRGDRLVDGQIDDGAWASGTVVCGRVVEQLCAPAQGHPNRASGVNPKQPGAKLGRYVVKIGARDTVVVNTKVRIKCGDLCFLQLKRPPVTTRYAQKDALYKVLERATLDRQLASGGHGQAPAGVGDRVAAASPGAVLIHAPSYGAAFLDQYAAEMDSAGFSLFYFCDVDWQCPPVGAWQMLSKSLDLYRRELDSLWGQALSPRQEITESCSIVLEETEALTAIDVNVASGLPFQACQHILTRIFHEIAFRRIAGLILIDFPRGSPARDKHVLEICRRLAGRGASVLGYSRAGLIEITQTRVQNSLRHLYEGNFLSFGTQNSQ